MSVLAGPREDAAGALEALAELLGAPASRRRRRRPARRPPPTGGAIDAATLGAAVAATLPEGAIVVDESVTAAAPILAATAGAPPHDWLTVTGGSIGLGLPARPAPPSRARTGRCCAWTATARRCTRSSRCGRRRARAWT